MIERAIENWLTNTTERSYQLPFCQVLLHKGHRVIDISKHGPMERGKDIVTISPDGTPCAWQLKTGKINTRTWREIKGEVMEMIELPITHPSVDKSVLHRSYLVTKASSKTSWTPRADSCRRGPATSSCF